VLHCYADYKWTGPSGPVARLCRALTERGWRSDLACMSTGDATGRSLPGRAREMGLTVYDDFDFESALHLRKCRADVRRLRELVDGGDYGLVHCHGSRDHLIGSWAMRGRRGEVLLLRTDHGAHRFRKRLPWRVFYGPPMIDHLIVLSDRFAFQAANLLHVSTDFVSTVRGAVDTQKYRPRTPPDGLREHLGFAAEDVIFGVVSRVQWHRRFDVLLEAAQRMQELDPRVKVAVCGRGTHRKEILDDPVVEMGLGEAVFPLGYRRDDYLDVLATFDAGVMLVPGSDASCRAAMEMAAMGTPLIVSQRGTLPDIVRDGETGMVMDDTPENLAEAVLEMAADPVRRREMGAAARERMKTVFSQDVQVEKVIAVYEQLLAER
jgi:glycosyltransferase involved in cell wall biosynthesis